MVMCSLFRAGSVFGAPKSKSDFIYRGDESDWSQNILVRLCPGTPFPETLIQPFLLTSQGPVGRDQNSILEAAGSVDTAFLPSALTLNFIRSDHVSTGRGQDKRKRHCSMTQKVIWISELKTRVCDIWICNTIDWLSLMRQDPYSEI
ncbi:Pisatin demethylase [Fusarium oxysporum f. sp. albedinis]|nr:Pisatin demethylase [Fusarium oxysporum f. sp. albedinis]